MPGVVALLFDVESRARVVAALRGRASVVFCGTRAELLARVAQHCPAAVIVALRDESGAPTASLIRAVRRGYPSAAVVGHCAQLTADVARDIVAAARAGMTQLLVKDAGDTGATLRAALDAAAHDALAREVARALRGDVDPSLLALLRYCVANAHRALTAADVADGMDVRRRTLAHRLARAGLPAPGVTIGWCRLIVAARMLEDPGRTVAQVAAALEFPSGAALRAMLMRYTGLRPTEVRATGGAMRVLGDFRRSVTGVPEADGREAVTGATAGQVGAAWAGGGGATLGVERTSRLSDAESLLRPLGAVLSPRDAARRLGGSSQLVVAG